MAYSGQEATLAALAQADKHKAEAARLRKTIADHYKAIHNNDWGFDDVLWDAIGLVADPDVIG